MRLPAILLALVACCVPAAAQIPSALADYVNREDGAYSYSLVNVLRNPEVQVGGTLTPIAADVYFMHLVSQEWSPTDNLSTGFQENRQVWEHEVAIIVPNVIRSTTASLHITGGGNASGGLDRFDYFNTMSPNASGQLQGGSEIGAFAAFAAASGSIMTILNQTPNQSISYTNDAYANSRSEDASIAKTIQNFIAADGQETDWPLLLPMTKAAVKAMDMTQDFIATNPLPQVSGFVGANGGYRTPSVQDFVVSGGSKRGWTTWLTAAVDDRVKAIVPIVFDALNLGQQLENQKAIYSRVSNDLTSPDSSGAVFSGSLQPYISSSGPIIDSDGDLQYDPNAFPDMDLTVQFADEYGRQALEIIDPFTYRESLTMPKYIVNSAGDEFFSINSSNNYFHDLEGDKYLWYVPNTVHGIAANPDGTANNEAVAQFLESYTAFYGALKSGEDLPEYKYTLLNDNKTIRVEFLNGLLPDEVTLWYNDGYNGEPDFRRGGVKGTGPDNIRSTWYQWDPSQSIYSLSYLGNGVFEATANDTTHWQAFMLQFYYTVDSVPFLDPSNPDAGWSGARFRFSSGVSIVGPEPLVYLGPKTTLAEANSLNALELAALQSRAVPEVSTLALSGTMALIALGLATLRRSRQSRS